MKLSILFTMLCSFAFLSGCLGDKVDGNETYKEDQGVEHDSMEHDMNHDDMDHDHAEGEMDM